MHPPRPLEGRFSRVFVRRDEVRRLRAGRRRVRHSGGIGAPSGATRSPRQELADIPAGHLRRCRRRKAGPGAVTAAIGAPRGASVSPRGGTNHRFALFGAPSPFRGDALGHDSRGEAIKLALTPPACGSAATFWNRGKIGWNRGAFRQLSLAAKKPRKGGSR
jgi:hypothetical protein